MTRLIMWEAPWFVALIVVGMIWVLSGGYKNDSWTSIFFMTWGACLIGVVASLFIVLGMGR
jgi:hypothetical protein